MSPESVLCPKCKKDAIIKERAALIGMPPRQYHANVYTCETCEVPEYDALGDAIYYRPITFLWDGSEVI